VPTPEEREALRRKIESLIADLDAVYESRLVAVERARIATELSGKLRKALREFDEDERG
jgi:hypothetical protein